MTDCAICFAEITAETGQTTLSCGHPFHVRCIVRWFQRPDGAGTCPCCRREPTEFERVSDLSGSASESDSDSDDEEEDEDEEDLASVSTVEPTSLMEAILEGDRDRVGLCIEAAVAGGTLDAADGDGDTAVHYACLEGRLDLLRLLADAGAGLNRTNHRAYQPIHTASEEQHLDCIRFLIEKGIDLTQKTHGGHTPLSIAAMFEDEEAVDLLLSAGCTQDVATHAFLVAAASDSPSVMEPLVRAGAGVNTVNEHGLTPFLAAVVNGAGLACLKKLVELGSDWKARDQEGRGCLELMVAHLDEQDEDACAWLIAKLTQWKWVGDRWARTLEIWQPSAEARMPWDLKRRMDPAAKKIQAVWRGHTVRQRPDYVPPWILRMLRTTEA
jgi:ankyrin repeat protein